MWKSYILINQNPSSHLSSSFCCDSCKIIWEDRRMPSWYNCIAHTGFVAMYKRNHASTMHVIFFVIFPSKNSNVKPNKSSLFDMKNSNIILAQMKEIQYKIFRYKPPRIQTGDFKGPTNFGWRIWEFHIPNYSK